MISGEIIVFAYNYFSLQYSVFSAAKIACKAKAESNQVCEARLIPGLNLVHFREYGPLGFGHLARLTKCVFRQSKVFIYK